MTRRCPEDGMRYTESFLTTQTCINNSNTAIQQYNNTTRQYQSQHAYQMKRARNCDASSPHPPTNCSRP